MYSIYCSILGKYKKITPGDWKSYVVWHLAQQIPVTIHQVARHIKGDDGKSWHCFLTILVEVPAVVVRVSWVFRRRLAHWMGRWVRLPRHCQRGPRVRFDGEGALRGCYGRGRCYCRVKDTRNELKDVLLSV